MSAKYESKPQRNYTWKDQVRHLNLRHGGKEAGGEGTRGAAGRLYRA